MHLICYSGGHSSALVAIEVARKYGTANMVLLNHDIHVSVEHPDIKRFKLEVAAHLGLPVTYANHRGDDTPVVEDQFDVCVDAGAFKVGDGSELCTHRLKTRPFWQWLEQRTMPGWTTVYYGFDPNEMHRVQRRSSIMAAKGYATDFPLALWRERTIQSTEEIGIARPLTYGVFKHGNCVGCLKAGWQHWYVVWCTRPDIWERGKQAEDEIGYAIHHDRSGPVYLEDMEAEFTKMQAAGVEPTEQTHPATFWAKARKVVKIHVEQESQLPCECVI